MKTKIFRYLDREVLNNDVNARSRDEVKLVPKDRKHYFKVISILNDVYYLFERLRYKHSYEIILLSQKNIIRNFNFKIKKA